jgi:hypothetical protein
MRRRRRIIDRVARSHSATTSTSPVPSGDAALARTGSVMGRNDDAGHLNAPTRQMLKQLYAIHLGYLPVHNQTLR